MNVKNLQNNAAASNNQSNFVLPEYDKVDWEPDENVVFHKGGVKGYIIEETGEFVPIDQFEDDEKYDDAYIFNTFCDN